MKHLRSVLQILAFVWVCSPMQTQAAEASKKPESSDIEYNSLEEALKALRAKAGVTFRNEGGWLVAEDMSVPVAWLLTPEGHPAYPSIVRRGIVNSPDGAHFVTSTRCFASKVVCDRYFGGK